MTDTTINTGWTPIYVPKPANLDQIEALLKKISLFPFSQERENARLALMCAIESLHALTAKMLETEDADLGRHVIISGGEVMELGG